MFPLRTGIDRPTFPMFQLQIGELIVGLSQRPFGKTRQIRLQLGSLPAAKGTRRRQTKLSLKNNKE